MKWLYGEDSHCLELLPQVFPKPKGTRNSYKSLNTTKNKVSVVSFDAPVKTPTPPPAAPPKVDGIVRFKIFTPKLKAPTPPVPPPSYTPLPLHPLPLSWPTAFFPTPFLLPTVLPSLSPWEFLPPLSTVTRVLGPRPDRAANCTICDFPPRPAVAHCNCNEFYCEEHGGTCARCNNFTACGFCLGAHTCGEAWLLFPPPSLLEALDLARATLLRKKLTLATNKSLTSQQTALAT